MAHGTPPRRPFDPVSESALFANMEMSDFDPFPTETDHFPCVYILHTLNCMP